MRKFAFALVAGVSSLSLQSAQAGGLFNFDPAPSGFYVSGFGGGSFLSDSDFRGVSNPVTGIPGPTGVAGVPLDVNLDYDNSAYYGGSLGYQLPIKYFGFLHPRLEVEVSYLDVDVGNGSFNGGTQTFQGSQDALFVYLNNYSDIIYSPDQKFTPYFGGGLGAAFVDSNVGYFPGTATAPTFAVTGSDTAFASHAAIGGTYALSENLDLYSEGRFFRIYGAQFDRTFVGGGANLFNGELDDDIQGFTLTGGLRYRF